VSSGIVRRSEAAAVRAGIIAEQMKEQELKTMDVWQPFQ
jgi:hypothetical protein